MITSGMYISREIIPLQIEPQHDAVQAFEASKVNMGNGKEAGENIGKCHG